MLAYVTRERDGVKELLVFDHRDDPSAGTQVPAGRLDPGETLEQCLLRELDEEAGIDDGVVVRELPRPDRPSRYENHAFEVRTAGHRAPIPGTTWCTATATTQAWCSATAGSGCGPTSCSSIGSTRSWRSCEDRRDRWSPSLLLGGGAQRGRASRAAAMFPADNPWNLRVDSLPVAANSDAIIASIGAGTGLHPDFGSGKWDGGPIGIPYNVGRRDDDQEVDAIRSSTRARATPARIRSPRRSTSSTAATVTR